MKVTEILRQVEELMMSVKMRDKVKQARRGQSTQTNCLTIGNPNREEP